jgi:hypothetical protein
MPRPCTMQFLSLAAALTAFSAGCGDRPTDSSPDGEAAPDGGADGGGSAAVGGAGGGGGAGGVAGGGAGGGAPGTGPWTVWRVSLESELYTWRLGASPRVIDAPAGADIIGNPSFLLSPDRTRLADWHESDVLRLVDLESGKVTAMDVGLPGVKVHSNTHGVLWSKGSQKMAFLAGDKVVVANGDGSSPRIVGPMKGQTLCFSADGARLLNRGTWEPDFQVIDVVKGEVLLPAPSTAAKALLELGAEPKLSPDGVHVAILARGGDLAPSTLMFSRVDGTSEHVVMVSGVWSGGWSPDGTRFAVLGSDGVSLNAPDGESIFVPVPTDEHFEAAWSPTRAELLISSVTGTAIAAADGSARSLPFIPTTFGRPRWSPDGDLAMLDTGKEPKDNVSHLLERATWEERASIGPGSITFFGPTGWLLISGTQTVSARTADPATPTLSLPSDHWQSVRYVGEEHVAYAVGPTLRVARLDGTEDLPLFEADAAPPQPTQVLFAETDAEPIYCQ